MSQKQSSKKMIQWIVGILAILLLFFAFLPTLFSTKPGTKLLLGMIRATTGQELAVEDLSLSWFGPQKATLVTWKDPKRHLQFHSSHIDTEAPLWKLSSLDVNLNVHQGELQITPPQMQPIVFQNIEIRLNVPKKNLPLIFAITGTTQQQGIVGSFNIQGEISGFNTDQPQGAIRAKVNQLPVQGIDQVLNLQGFLTEAVGATMDLEINANTLNEALFLDIQAASSQLTAKIQANAKNHQLQLTTPAIVSLKVTPALAEKLSLTLTKETLLTATIDQLSCPVKEDGLDYPLLQFNAILDLDSFCLSGLAFDGIEAHISSPQIDQAIHVSLNATSPQFTLSTLQFSIAKTIELSAPVYLSYPLEENSTFYLDISSLKIPFPLDLHKTEIVANAKLSPWDIDTHIVAHSLDNLDISSTGKNFNTTLKAKIENNIFYVKQPFTIETSLSTQFIEAYFNGARLSKTAAITIEMQPLSLPLYHFQMDKLKIKGKASASELLLISKEGSHQFPLVKPSVEFAFDGAKHTASLDISSAVDQGTLTINCSLSEFTAENSAQAVITANGSIKNLSPAFIDTLLGEKFSLQTLLGNKLDFQFKLQSNAVKQTFFVSAKSPNLNMSGNFLLEDNLLKLQSPGLNLHFVMEEKAYPLLDNGPFKLKQPAICSLTIDELNIPLSSPAAIHSLSDRIPHLCFAWDLIRLKGELLLKEVEYQQFSVNDTQLNFEKRDNLSFRLNSHLSPQGQIQVSGELPGNSISQIKINALIKDFPTIILDLLARLSGQNDLSFLPVFGKTLNAEVKLNLNDYNGPVAFNIASENTHISLKGEVEHGYLTLNDALYAQVLMTPELSALLLKQMNPLSIKEITSKTPITLEISSGGFLLPINPFDPSKLFISKGTVELGRLSCHNEGNINTTLSLLKWSKVGKGDILKLWFAPCVFSIKQGVAAIERTEILIADSLDVALWGNIDLPQRYVDMKLGLTASALSSAFGIKNLPKDYVLQIPMKGPMDNVSVDTGSATTKLAILFAWQQNLAGSLGGSVGSFLGGLVNKAVPLPDINSKAPPAKHPFPWEQPQKQKSAGRPIKKGDKPLKQLLKTLY